ncbi:hypothetical protein LNTAR_06329 [Lentisphaera araneosa HTCC2155]|uniref:Uncharacterized protein n=1 Tax=Lentisphaera araneosa HTCC2155 TaxID=313628 RepID=A6DN92_9BACT|nr:hypothetical protein LNTAR_06329 [Lentisphaera araneosa HTCC2155]
MNKIIIVLNSFILGCIPMIFLSENQIISIKQSVFHKSQLLACIISFFVGTYFIIKNKKQKSKFYYFVLTSNVLIGLWLLFITSVILIWTSIN